MYTYGNILVVVLSGYPVYEKLTARQGGDDDERISEVVVIFELICVTIKHSGNTYIFIYLFFFYHTQFILLNNQNNFDPMTT